MGLNRYIDVIREALDLMVPDRYSVDTKRTPCYSFLKEVDRDVTVGLQN